MDESLHAALEEMAALVEEMRSDRHRFEETLKGGFHHLGAAESNISDVALSLTGGADRLSQAADAIMRQTHTIARYVRWFPWKLAAAISGALVVVLCALNLFWIAQFSAAHRHTVETLEQYKALALALDRHLIETLYDQLSPGRQRKLDHVYRRAQVVPPGDRTTHTGREGR